MPLQSCATAAWTRIVWFQHRHQSHSLSKHLLAGLPYLAALVDAGYAHNGIPGQTEGRGCPQGSWSFSLLCFQKNWYIFIPPLLSPKVLYLSSLQKSSQKTRDSLLQEQGGDGLSALPCCRPAQPTLQRVTKHQAGIFNSTMLMCDNTIPTSFLPRVKPGDKRREEAVITTTFHQSNPSLMSYQSGCLSSQCPCSFFSSSVTGAGDLFTKISLLRYRDVCLPQRTPCLHFTSLWLLCSQRKLWQLKACVLTYRVASMINQFL